MITYIPLRNEHIHDVVAIHMAAFPDFFLTALGEKFLKLFYSAFISDDEVVAIVAFDKEKNKTMGCVVGSISPHCFFRKLLLSKGFSFAMAGIPAVLHSPRVAKRLLHGVFYRGDTPIGYKNYALLSSIAVAPACQGTGVGSELIQAWLMEIKKKSAPGAYLATDADNNVKANHFYQKNGWRLTQTFTTSANRRMNYYIKIF